MFRKRSSTLAQTTIIRRVRNKLCKSSTAVMQRSTKDSRRSCYTNVHVAAKRVLGRYVDAAQTTALPPTNTEPQNSRGAHAVPEPKLTSLHPSAPVRSNQAASDTESSPSSAERPPSPISSVRRFWRNLFAKSDSDISTPDINIIGQANATSMTDNLVVGVENNERENHDVTTTKTEDNDGNLIKTEASEDSADKDNEDSADKVKVDEDKVNEDEDGDEDSSNSDSDDSDDENSEDGKSPEKEENDRRDIEAIRWIPHRAVTDIIREMIYPDNEGGAIRCRVSHTKEGSFHHCIFLDIKRHHGQETELLGKYVLKIPFHGTEEHWQDGDAFMLRNEAVLMQHIRHHTTCPVPEIIAFDDTRANGLGAPYILMKKIEGISALHVWMGLHLPGPPKNDEEHLEADDPKPALEEIRKNFLKSLANAMSQLKTLKFDQIGVPVFDKPEDDKPSSYGPVWRWHSPLEWQPLTAVGPFETRKEFFQAGLDNVWNMSQIEEEKEEEDVHEFMGMRKLLEMILASEPFAIEPQGSDLPKERFVLRHDDLDLQNILCDAAGNVTGIIDWDGCMTAPEFLGYTSLPKFLRRDWLSSRSMSGPPYLTWGTHFYLWKYTEAMEDACDAKAYEAHTCNSGMHQAVLALLFDDEPPAEIVEKLVNELHGFRRVDFRDLCIKLGKGWPAAEARLTQRFEQLLER
jgi:hypothetical protein